MIGEVVRAALGVDQPAVRTGACLGDRSAGRFAARFPGSAATVQLRPCRFA